MPLGGLITLAVLLPNLLMLFMPPREVPPQTGEKDARYRLMEGLERVGQAGVFLIPFFYPLPVLRYSSVDALVVMALALLFYYSGWARYANKGHRFVLLYAPFLGVPLPMATSPLVYFAAASVFLSAWPLAAATIVLAVGHLYISHLAWKRSDPKINNPLLTPRRG
jgi:hypothetical protein